MRDINQQKRLPSICAQVLGRADGDDTGATPAVAFAFTPKAVGIGRKLLDVERIQSYGTLCFDALMLSGLGKNTVIFDVLYYGGVVRGGARGGPKSDSCEALISLRITYHHSTLTSTGAGSRSKHIASGQSDQTLCDFTVYNKIILLRFTGPPVPITARVHLTPARIFDILYIIHELYIHMLYTNESVAYRRESHLLSTFSSVMFGLPSHAGTPDFIQKLR
eukprot:3750386-Pyramimonas_sp.AAC.1